jgi:hypothetical protein
MPQTVSVQITVSEGGAAYSGSAWCLLDTTYLVDLNQYHLVGRREIDLVAIVVDKASNGVDHHVSFEVAVVADGRPDGKLRRG